MKRNNYIVLCGPNGCGKTTHGGLLVNKIPKAVHTDMSFLIKVKFLQDPKFQEEYGSKIAEGDLLPCSVVIDLFQEHSERIRYENHILTGFPRTLVQAVALVQYLQNRYGYGSALSNMIVFEHKINEAQAVERAMQRKVLALKSGQKPRPDDEEIEIVQHRFELYHTETYHALEHFCDLGVEVIQIDATREPQVVHGDIMSHVRRKFSIA